MKKILLCLSLSFLVLLGCKDDMETVSNPDNTSTISLSVSNLPKLNDQLVYQGWLIFDDAGTSYKKVISFQPGTDGKYESTFTTELYDLKRTKYFVITLELANEDSANQAKPSNLKVLAGILSANDLSLVFKQSSDTLSIYNSIKDISGVFTLYSPTFTANEDSLIGVWFANYNNGVLAQGLTLPTLPSGWSYEGWVLSGKYIFSTGTFTSAVGKDGSNAYCSTGTIPEFPGEDFIKLTGADTTFSSVAMQNASILITINHPVESSFTPYMLRLPVLYGNAQGVSVKQSKAFEKSFPSVLPNGTIKVNAKI